MTENNWNQMTGWEKTWEVTKVVGGVAIFLLPFLLRGKPGPKPRVMTPFRPQIIRPVGGPKGWIY